MFPKFPFKAEKTKYQLPPKRMVWCIQSEFPNRLCTGIVTETSEAWIYVAEKEQDALTEILTGYWEGCTPSKFRPIELSLDSVIEQVFEQAPSSGLYPCVGYMMLPSKTLVRVK
jgi:hypothetical protein